MSETEKKEEKKKEGEGEKEAETEAAKEEEKPEEKKGEEEKEKKEGEEKKKEEDKKAGEEDAKKKKEEEKKKKAEEKKKKAEEKKKAAEEKKKKKEEEKKKKAEEKKKKAEEKKKKAEEKKKKKKKGKKKDEKKDEKKAEEKEPEKKDKAEEKEPEKKDEKKGEEKESKEEDKKKKKGEGEKDKKEEDKKEKEKEPEKKEEEKEPEKKEEEPPATETQAFRSPLLAADTPFPTVIYEGEVTIDGNFEQIVSVNESRECYAFRDIVKYHHSVEKHILGGKVTTTAECGALKKLLFSETNSIVKALSCGLRKTFSEFSRGSLVGMAASTCKEWMITALASFRNAWTLVSMNPLTLEDEFVRIINQCEVSTLLVDVEQVKLFERVGEKCECLKSLIVVGKIPKDFKRGKLTCYRWYDLVCEGHGGDEPDEKDRSKAEDLAMIAYTQGTTGEPRGVMIEHKEFVAVCSGLKRHLNVGSKDVYLSYLPLASVTEFALHLTYLFSGCLVGFGSPKTLVKGEGNALNVGDARVIQPTTMVGVPAVWDKLRKTCECECNVGSFKKLQGKKKAVSSKLSDCLGGKVKVLLSVGGFLSPEMHGLLKAGFKKASILQGYGMVETGGWITLSRSSDALCVGVPIPNCEVKVVNSGKYTVSGDVCQGELLVRGPILFRGYYKNSELTMQVCKDGWLHSGDIVTLDKPSGTFTVIDRIVDIIEVEDVLLPAATLAASFLQSPFVVANGLCLVSGGAKDKVGALVVASPAFANLWASANKILFETMDEVFERDDFRAAIVNSFGEISKKSSLNVVPKAVEIVEEIEVTAGGKIRRVSVLKKYENITKTLFDEKKEKLKEEKEKKKDVPKIFEWFM